MASVMPTATYPKSYRVNGVDYVMHNAAEDTSFHAGPIYFAAIPIQTYPKTLVLGGHQYIAKNAGEESGERSYCGQG